MKVAVDTNVLVRAVVRDDSAQASVAAKMLTGVKPAVGVRGMIVGALPVLLSVLLTMNLFGLVFLGIYLFVAVPLVYSRLSGFQFFK